jgi:hypothetical protein
MERSILRREELEYKPWTMNHEPEEHSILIKSKMLMFTLSG